MIDLRADRAVGRREFQSHLLAGGGVAKSQAVLSGVCHQFGKEAGQARAVERLEGQGIRLRERPDPLQIGPGPAIAGDHTAAQGAAGRSFQQPPDKLQTVCVAQIAMFEMRQHPLAVSRRPAFEPAPVVAENPIDCRRFDQQQRPMAGSPVLQNLRVTSVRLPDHELHRFVRSPGLRPPGQSGIECARRATPVDRSRQMPQ
ncbi:hypothetical protein, partial [Accumulibacter sp.]|uniref:hypothetical protein n=1 Tax=Accumulibacter sp. TaxID=2053492 RepID=UPI002D1FBE00